MLRKLFEVAAQIGIGQAQRTINNHTQQQLFSNYKHTRFFNFQRRQAAFDSTMTLTQIDASNAACAKVYNNDDGSFSEIGEFTTEKPTAFIALLQGSVSLTLGFRAAFYPVSPLTHAVLLVQNGEQQAILGYQKINGQGTLINDIYNESTDGTYYFYDDLTIEGDAQHAKNLLARVARTCSKMQFNGVNNNCYTPLVTHLAKASPNEFKIPPRFIENLFYVLPNERNFGMGVALHEKFKKYYTSRPGA